jgi:hypothetical protein
MQKLSRRTIGTLIFLAGQFIGIGLALTPIWGDFEGMSYFSNGAGYAPFGGLHCPILMAGSDTAAITATLDNRQDKEVQPYYEVEISGISETRSLEGQLTLAPHSSKTVQWTVDANDIDLGFFIIAKIDILPYAGNPLQEATCGIIVMNLGGLHSGQIFGWGLALSLIGMVFGLGLRETTEQTRTAKEGSTKNGLRATGITTCLAMLAAFQGWWLIGLILCAITILLVVILLRFAVS